eukprot:3815367-Amphidinium_carterae.1
MLGNLGARAYRRTIILVGGSATLWGMPPEWDIMVTRALAYFRKRNIQCQDGTFMWHNIQWGTSKTGSDRDGTMACRFDGSEQSVHIADVGSDVWLPNGVDRRECDQQRETPSD